MKTTKIVINYYDKNNTLSEEIVWAENYKDNYYIKNIPFFAPSIAYNDLISVEQEDDILYFDELIEVSNNSTVRIIFFTESEYTIKQVLDEIEKNFCEWEGMTDRPYYAVNIPKDINYNTVKQYLDQQKLTLDYEESCLSEKHKLDIIEF